MSRIKIWQRVPDGAKLTVSVSGDEGATASAEFHTDKGGDQVWPDLHRKPKTRTLRAPIGYSVRVTVGFAKQATALVDAKIVKTDGSVYGDAFTSSELTAKAGTKIVSIFAKTTQS